MTNAIKWFNKVSSNQNQQSLSPWSGYNRVPRRIAKGLLADKDRVTNPD